jgi:hypothetical protein
MPAGFPHKMAYLATSLGQRLPLVDGGPNAAGSFPPVKWTHYGRWTQDQLAVVNSFDEVIFSNSRFYYLGQRVRI